MGSAPVPLNVASQNRFTTLSPTTPDDPPTSGITEWPERESNDGNFSASPVLEDPLLKLTHSFRPTGTYAVYGTDITLSASEATVTVLRRMNLPGGPTQPSKDGEVPPMGTTDHSLTRPVTAG